MNNEAMRAGAWESDSDMTPEQEASDRRFLDSLVANSPGPAYQWRMEVAVSIEGRNWRWRSANPISDPNLPPLTPP
jgi:hypothetical protein